MEFRGVVLGDERTGKTSLLKNLNCVAPAENTYIYSVKASNVAISFKEYSNLNFSQYLSSKLSSAVIIVLYDTSSVSSFESLFS